MSLDGGPEGRDQRPESVGGSEIVVDASVAAKWLMRDEEYVEQADGILRASDEGTLALFAPRQIDVEVAAVLRKAVLQRRLSAVAAADSLRRWFESLRPRLQLVENDDLLTAALPRSLQLGITLFDALYLTLAETLDVPLVAADSRLVRSPVAQLARVCPLSTYRLPA